MTTPGIPKTWFMDLTSTWQSKINLLKQEYIEMIGQADKDFEKSKEKILSDKKVEIDRLNEKRERIEGEFRQRLEQLENERYEIDNLYNEKIKTYQNELEPKKDRLKSKYSADIQEYQNRLGELSNVLAQTG